MLTFDSIRELERQEKANKKMQKLPLGLDAEINDYIKRKEKTADKTSADILELENVKNTIKRFFELRERKLIDMAVSTVRTGLPAENLDPEETKIFYMLVGALQENRSRFFSDINKENENAGQDAVQEEKPQKIEMLKEIQQEAAALPKKTVFRVKADIAEFVGPDLRTYRLIRGEVVKLPKELNELLLKEGILEEIPE
jgi:DNA replication initiation complex subunit (GINS family)